MSSFDYSKDFHRDILLNSPGSVFALCKHKIATQFVYCKCSMLSFYYFIVMQLAKTTKSLAHTHQLLQQLVHRDLVNSIFNHIAFQTAVYIP